MGYLGHVFLGPLFLGYLGLGLPKNGYSLIVSQFCGRWMAISWQQMMCFTIGKASFQTKPRGLKGIFRRRKLSVIRKDSALEILELTLALISMRSFLWGESLSSLIFHSTRHKDITEMQSKGAGCWL